MGYAFISYSSKNQSSADAMRELFNKNAIDTWMAPYDIPSGSEYAEVLYDALIGCSCLVLMLTNNAQNSPWVKKEVNIAITSGKTVIPVKLEDIELNSSMKLYLNDQQITVVHKIDENAYEIKQVLEAVKTCTKYSIDTETTLTDPPFNNATPHSELLQRKTIADSVNEATSCTNVHKPASSPEIIENTPNHGNTAPQSNTNGITFNTQRIESLRKFLPHQRKTGTITRAQIQVLIQMEEKSKSDCTLDWNPIKKFDNRDCYDLEKQQMVNKQLIIPDDYTEIVNHALSCSCSKKIYIPKGINWIDKDCLLDLGKEVKTIYIEKDSVWYHISDNGKAISSYGGNKEKLWVKNGVTLKYYSRKAASSSNTDSDDNRSSNPIREIFSFLFE